MEYRNFTFHCVYSLKPSGLWAQSMARLHSRTTLWKEGVDPIHNYLASKFFGRGNYSILAD